RCAFPPRRFSATLKAWCRALSKHAGASFLPGTGRWLAAGETEGSKGPSLRLGPSTIALRATVPLPVPGRNRNEPGGAGMNLDGIIAIAGVIVLLLVGGGVIGLVDRRNFRWRWLLVAAGLVLANDALLTLGWGTLPDLIGGAWNWQGKLLALAATLAIAALPAF